MIVNIQQTPHQQTHWLTSALRSLVSDSFVYLIGAGLLGLGSFILVPLYTRILRPDEFGIYALLDVSIAIFVLLAQLKLDVAYLKTFADLESSEHPNLLSTVFWIGALAAGLGGGLLWLVAASPLGGKLLQTTDRGFAWTLLPIVAFEGVQGLLLSDLRARRRAVAYCSATLVRLLGIVAASIYLLSYRHLGLYGLFMGRALGDVVGIVLLLFFCRYGICFRIDWRLLRPMIAFGTPIVWAALMMMLMDAAGRYILSRCQGLAEVGYLGAAIKISGIFQLLIAQPFGIAWGGLMFQIQKWPQAKSVYSKIFTYVLVLAMVATFCIALFSELLFKIFATKAYAAGMTILPLLLLVRGVTVLEYPAAISIYLKGRTHWFALIYSLGLVVNIVANVLLDPRSGDIGVAWSWLLGWLTIITAMRVVGDRLYKLQYNWKLVTLVCLPWALFLCSTRENLLRILHAQWFMHVLIATVISCGAGLLSLRDLRRARPEAA